MRAALAVGAAALALGACAMGSRESPYEIMRERLANRAKPSDVIATELAFARMARERGTWTAFRQYAARDAVMPSPGIVLVSDALDGVPDPAEPIVWEPDAVWLSCRGDYALSTGPATYPDGHTGRFATIWQRIDGGEYRWVLDQNFPLEDGYEKPEFVAAVVADCEAPEVVRDYPDAVNDWSRGQSPDGTLTWDTAIAADCARSFTATMFKEGKWEEVFRRAAPAPAGVGASDCAG